MRHTQRQQHVVELQREIQELKKQLTEANEVARFYGDKCNYSRIGHQFRIRVLRKDDEERLPFSQMYYAYYGGKRARAYMNKWGIE